MLKCKRLQNKLRAAERIRGAATAYGMERVRVLFIRDLNQLSHTSQGFGCGHAEDLQYPWSFGCCLEGVFATGDSFEQHGGIELIDL